MQTTPTYHEGEHAMQTRANVTVDAARNSRMIRDAIPDTAISFVHQQSLAVIGSMDAGGRVWCSIVFGEAGFLRAADTRRIQLDTRRAVLLENDPLWQNLATQPLAGMLLIELPTRRRLRINGRLTKFDEYIYQMNVAEAYPNCPKYIKRRKLHVGPADSDQPAVETIQGTVLSPSQTQLIQAADTFFVASAHPMFGLDASHRGGQPGFVQVLDDRLLRIPDYKGNNMFNTLGNFTSYPHAGLVFLDFNQNVILQLTGSPVILWDTEGAEYSTGGTGCYWQFAIEYWQQSTLHSNLKWEYLEPT